MKLKRTRKDSELYGIIGLGRFGFALAKALADVGKDIVVLDQNEAKINAASAFTENAFVVDDLTRENLETCGVQNCDTVVVCIGERIDTSILTTLTVLRLGVKQVIAKATTEEQGAVLETLGAKVVYPEHDMAVRLANHLIAPHILEYIALSPEINIIELSLTPRVNGMTVAELDLRKRFGLNIIAIKQDDQITTDIFPGTRLVTDSSLTVIGKKDGFLRFEAYLRQSGD